MGLGARCRKYTCKLHDIVNGKLRGHCFSEVSRKRLAELREEFRPRLPPKERNELVAQRITP